MIPYCGAPASRHPYFVLGQRFLHKTRQKKGIFGRSTVLLSTSASALPGLRHVFLLRHKVQQSASYYGGAHQLQTVLEEDRGLEPSPSPSRSLWISSLDSSLTCQGVDACRCCSIARQWLVCCPTRFACHVPVPDQIRKIPSTTGDRVGHFPRDCVNMNTPLLLFFLLSYTVYTCRLATTSSADSELESQCPSRGSLATSLVRSSI
jgi:hypothetical protein